MLSYCDPNMLIQDLFIILALVLAGLFWWHDRGIKQRAFLYAKRKCDQIDVQLLDQNVRLSGLAITRKASGALAIKRTFSFEFTVTGEHRYSGKLTMVGNQLESLETDAHQIH